MSARRSSDDDETLPEAEATDEATTEGNEQDPPAVNPPGDGTDPVVSEEPAAAAAEAAPYIAKVRDPEPPAAEESTEEARRIELPEGQVTVIYRGLADLFSHGEHRFRPGEPVAVPSEVAEDLLTHPFEPFEAPDLEAPEPQKE